MQNPEIFTIVLTVLRLVPCACYFGILVISFFVINKIPASPLCFLCPLNLSCIYPFSLSFGCLSLPPLFPFPHTRPSNGSGNASSPLIMRVVKSQAATHRGARGHHSGGMARMNERTKGTDYIAVSEWVSEQLLALPLLPSPFSSNFMPQSYSICGL